MPTCSENAVSDVVSRAAETAPDKIEHQVREIAEAIKDKVAREIVQPISNDYNITQKKQKTIVEKAGREIDAAISRAGEAFAQKKREADLELHRKRENAATPSEVREAEAVYHADIQKAQNELNAAINETAAATLREKPKEIVEALEREKEEEKKKASENEIRARLRGFARTIPSFIMAYGDENLTLANFDKYTNEENVFSDVTGITLVEFRFLRDGGDMFNPETGKMEHFNGHLFDEVVFNDSIQEFLRKRTELADYFDENNEEDIFDYIPPQKTNQIFTPRRIVKLMVDKLEEENPGCFDDPKKTFADLYMKSGLFITEIVKRLYRSGKMKAAFPNDRERIRHILQKQVYGMAPTRIIYLIAMNYILGFDEKLKNAQHNFVEADASEAAKAGHLKALVEEKFGGGQPSGRY